MKNPLTIKRHQQALCDMIIDTMRNENLSMLEASGRVMRMVTSDEVETMVKAKVAKLNAGVA